MVFKQKSRPAGDDYKHSGHFIVECVGVPAKELAAICAAVFRPHAEALALCKKQGSYAPLKGDAIRWPGLGADVVTMKGNTGFATLFSKKRPGDPPSQLVHRAVYRGGQLVPAAALGQPNPKPFEPAGAPHEPAALPREDALWLLYQSCYSALKGYTRPVSPLAEDLGRARQNRTAARHHAAPGGGVPPPRGDAGALPAWLASVLAGAAVRREAAGSYFHNILKARPSLESWSAVHVVGGSVPCPASLALDPPVRHHHRSNGVIIVFDPASPSLVYTRCTNCRLDPGRLNDTVVPLKDELGGCTQWIELSEQSLGTLLRAGKEAGERPCAPLA